MAGLARDAIRGESADSTRGEMANLFTHAHETVRGIRRGIVTHLAADCQVDMPASLVLMSVVKDAERACEASVDVVRLRERGGGPTGSLPQRDVVLAVSSQVLDLFAKTARALDGSDAAMAREVMESQCGIAAECERLMSAILASETTVLAAGPWLLVVHRLNEIGLCLGKIAAGMVLPLDELDHYECRVILQEDGQ